MAMRRNSWKGALVAGAVALLGAAGTAQAAAGEQDVPGFIFHHVTDSNYYEFELPLWVPGPDDYAALALPTLMFPIREGATCGPMFAGFSLVTETQLQQAANVPRPGFGEGCLDLSPSKNVLMMFIGSVLLLLVFLLGTHKNRSQPVPRGRLANFLEMMVLFVRDELAIKNIGEKEGPRYVPYLLSAFFFILFLNLLGLIPFMSTATGALGTTVTLALITFFLTQVASIRAAGFGGYLKHLTGGVHWTLWPIMVPVEILGLFTKPFALTVRLFANMLAGHIILFFLISLIFIMGSVLWAGLAVPFAFAIYLLEIFVAFVQAYIFTMLSALFIGMGVAMGHHDDHHPAEVEGAKSHDHGRGHFVGG